MIKVVILEDEPAAANRLRRLIKQVRPNYKVVGDADTVEDAISLIENVSLDLILADIQLADGLSFEVFEKIGSNHPLIFITAFDDYAIRAFDFNGVQYLLKPISATRLNTALQKFESSPYYSVASKDLYPMIEKERKQQEKMVFSKVGNKTTLIKHSDIALIYSEHKMNKVVTFNQSSHLVDATLDELMTQLDSNSFFKINRQMILNGSAVLSLKKHTSNRILVQLKFDFDQDIIVSKERSPKFKSWLKNS